MNTVQTYLILTPFLLATALGAEDKLSPAPSGYSWQNLASIKSYVLKPNGWFFKETKKGNTEGFLVSKENIDKSGGAKTSLTLNCIHDLPKKALKSPSAYSAEFADAAAAKYKLVERTTSSQGPFKAVRFRYVDAPAGKESMTVLNLLIANDKTGTLFLILFESPTS